MILYALHNQARTMVRQIPIPRPINRFTVLIHTHHSLTVTMMSRITLHPKRFAHSSTTVDSNETHWHIHPPLRPSATHPRAPPRRGTGMPRLTAPPRAAFPPGLFTSVLTPYGTFLGGESFVLDLCPAAETDISPPKPSSGTVTSVADLEVPGNLNVQNPVTTVGDEELASVRGA
jgi:hypothetical protein